MQRFKRFTEKISFQAVWYLYKECGSHTREAAEEEFDSIGDCFGLGHTASENGAKIISVSDYPKRTLANEVISFTKIFLDAKPKYSWTSLEEYFQLKTKQLRSHLLLGFVCFKSQELLLDLHLSHIERLSLDYSIDHSELFTIEWFPFNDLLQLDLLDHKGWVASVIITFIAWAPGSLASCLGFHSFHTFTHGSSSPWPLCTVTTHYIRT